jgi:acyl carrier protein
VDLFEEIKEIICEELGVEPVEVTPETTFTKDLGADLPDLPGLVMALEENYGIEIPIEDAQRIKTVDDLVKYIENKID